MTHSFRCFILAGGLVLTAGAWGAVYQGNGIKIGEVTADSAVIWTRLTSNPDANWTGTPFIPPSLDGTRAEALQSATAVARESGMSASSAKAQQADAKRTDRITQAQL